MYLAAVHNLRGSTSSPSGSAGFGTSKSVSRSLASEMGTAGEGGGRASLAAEGLLVPFESCAVSGMMRAAFGGPVLCDPRERASRPNQG